MNAIPNPAQQISDIFERSFHSVTTSLQNRPVETLIFHDVSVVVNWFMDPVYYVDFMTNRNNNNLYYHISYTGKAEKHNIQDIVIESKPVLSSAFNCWFVAVVTKGPSGISLSLRETKSLADGLYNQQPKTPPDNIEQKIEAMVAKAIEKQQIETMVEKAVEDIINRKQNPCVKELFGTQHNVKPDYPKSSSELLDQRKSVFNGIEFSVLNHAQQMRMREFANIYNSSSPIDFKAENPKGVLKVKTMYYPATEKNSTYSNGLNPKLDAKTNSLIESAFLGTICGTVFGKSIQYSAVDFHADIETYDENANLLMLTKEVLSEDHDNFEQWVLRNKEIPTKLFNFTSKTKAASVFHKHYNMPKKVLIKEMRVFRSKASPHIVQSEIQGDIIFDIPKEDTVLLSKGVTELIVPIYKGTYYLTYYGPNK